MRRQIQMWFGETNTKVGCEDCSNISVPDCGLASSHAIYPPASWIIHSCTQPICNKYKICTIFWHMYQCKKYLTPLQSSKIWILYTEQNLQTKFYPSKSQQFWYKKILLENKYCQLINIRSFYTLLCKNTEYNLNSQPKYFCECKVIKGYMPLSFITLALTSHIHFMI